MTNFLRSAFGMTPFDPQKHQPQDLGLGGLSTEYLATEADANGEPFNFPTIWYQPNGKAVLVDVEAARTLALDYEQSTGKRFPRFVSFGAGAERAQHRSALGGASKNALVR